MKQWYVPYVFLCSYYTGLYIFQVTNFSCDDFADMCILFNIILTKSEICIFSHCLGGQGHETIVGAVCAAIFFCSYGYI